MLTTGTLIMAAAVAALAAPAESRLLPTESIIALTFAAVVMLDASLRYEIDPKPNTAEPGPTRGGGPKNRQRFDANGPLNPHGFLPVVQAPIHEYNREMAGARYQREETLDDAQRNTASSAGDVKQNEDCRCF
jgi:hypothetical protein